MDFSFTIDAWNNVSNCLDVTYTSSNGSHTVKTKQIKIDPERADNNPYIRSMVIAHAPVAGWREEDKVAALAEALDLSSFTDLVNGTDLDVSALEVDDAFPT